MIAFMPFFRANLGGLVDRLIRSRQYSGLRSISAMKRQAMGLGVVAFFSQERIVCGAPLALDQ
jgi:hypothetical protein